MNLDVMMDWGDLSVFQLVYMTQLHLLNTKQVVPVNDPVQQTCHKFDIICKFCYK